MFALWPSSTVTVIVALPLALATGAYVSVPVALGLVKAIVGSGINASFDELALTVKV